MSSRSSRSEEMSREDRLGVCLERLQSGELGLGQPPRVPEYGEWKTGMRWI